MSDLGERVQRHYELEANRHMHPNPVPGEMAVVKNINRYERVHIVSVESNVMVLVQLLDTSTECFSYKTSQLYSCDKIFKVWPYMMIDDSSMDSLQTVVHCHRIHPEKRWI